MLLKYEHDVFTYVNVVILTFKQIFFINEPPVSVDMNKQGSGNEIASDPIIVQRKQCLSFQCNGAGDLGRGGFRTPLIPYSGEYHYKISDHIVLF
jgi:hypothetical protein